MDYHRLLAPIYRRMSAMVGRCILASLDSSAGVQSAQVTLFADEEMKGVEYLEPYGFTSQPLAGAEGLALNVASQRGACVVVALGNRAFRLKGLKGGEVALYTDEGDKLVFEREHTVRLTTKKLIVEAEETVEINAGQKVTVNSPETELSGHLTVKQGITWGGNANGLGGPAQMRGGLVNTEGTVQSNGKVLDSHTHTCPDGETTGPN